MKTDDENQGNTKLVILTKLVDALTNYYMPVETPEDADETKSTQELINEMTDIEAIDSCDFNKLMEETRFKIHYNGSGYVWLLKIR